MLRMKGVNVKSILPQRILTGPDHRIASRMIFPVAGKNPAEQHREDYYAADETPLKSWEPVALEFIVRKNRHGP